jgi:hypothetical protein
MNPEQMLTRDAIAEGAVTCIDPEDLQRRQLKVLSQQLKQLIDKEASV